MLTQAEKDELSKPVHQRRHPEWRLQYQTFRRLLDAYEGGDAYRLAVYGTDTRGQPIRNLVRHKREYPDPREQPLQQGFTPSDRYPGQDPAAVATDDDYQLRLARTPVPAFVAECIETHLSAIYAEEVTRDSGDAALTAFWKDVDGKGTTADAWMAETVAPLLLALGTLDLVCDHPRAPDGAEVVSRDDQRRLGLDAVVASYVLPENMVWWLADDGDGYRECLVAEDAGRGKLNVRHWTAAESVLYDDGGKVLETVPHAFGRVPIRRVYDGKRRPRCRRVGIPRYEAVAELQREFYNRDSELILSDTTQAHPLLQGPEDFVSADGTVPVGPAWLLPKKKNTAGATVSYEGFDVVDFPKGGAESIRQNLALLRDRVDRAALLTKPAGAAGTDGNSVGQSGVSKRLDQSAGNNLLGKIAGSLQRAETVLAALAWVVSHGGKDPEPEAFAVLYPKSFDLLSPEELAAGLLSFQDALDRAGHCPETEGALLRKLVRQLLPGLDDDDYAECDDELTAFLDDRKQEKADAAAAVQEMPAAGGTYRLDPTTPPPGAAPAAPQPPEA